MPPKKKQEQIDLSTLPECKSLNIFLFAKGKNDRAQKILSKVNSKYQKSVFHVKKSAVLDYAKEKSLYVDPETLTDKQKKDPKFMETVCTQLTPQVLAKATDGYINNQNIKVRLQKKVLLQKPQTAQLQKNKKIDCIYIFDDFPTQTADFAALSAANQGIKFIFIYDPKISWVSAPQQPYPVQNPDQQPNQPDEEYQQFKKLKQAQALTQEDIKNQTNIQSTIKTLRDARKKSSPDSPFRNTVIQYIKCSIDPYNQQASIQSAVNSLIPTCEQLLASFSQFNTWKADKKSQKLPEFNQNQLNIKYFNQINKSGQKVDNTIQILSNILKSFKQQGKKQNNNNEQLIDFNKFDFSGVDIPPSNKNVQINKRNSPNKQFLEYNNKKLLDERKFLKQILQNMRYPGVDRYMMPQIPPKSEGLRKLYRSSFGQFLPPGETIHDFQRKMNILFLQSVVKEVDEQKTYDFSNRIYQEQHQRQSLLRQLNKALLFDQSTPVIKYNENNDKLYVCLLYKNPPRRMSKRLWECNWKVLPNLQNWLKYFKQNEINSGNNHFYDIDYELIGNVQEQISAWSVKDGQVIIRKRSIVAGKQNHMLYCLPGTNTGDLVFGLRQKSKKTEFYARNQIVSISCREVQNNWKLEQNNKSRSVFVSFKDQTVVQFRQNGDILIRKKNQKPRLITRDGYTIIYEKNKQNTILHPNGGISYPKSKYVNPNGRGMNNQRLQQVPTLKRSSQEGKQMITLRDDQTVIVEEAERKWIKFSDQTEYLIQNDEIIIQKKQYPVIKLVGNGCASFQYDGLHVEVANPQNQYFQYVFTFDRICLNNNSKIVFNPKQVLVFDGKTQTPYICGFGQNASISKSYEQQSVSVSFKNSKLQRKVNKVVDPEEQQQNFNQQDVVQPDYVQPRIFIINNDNTGVQLLSQKQLKKGYFDSFNKLNQQQIEKNKELHDKRAQIREIPHPNSATKTIIYGVLPIPSTNQLNKKRIKQTPVKLDIYNNLQHVNKQVEQNHRLYQVRSIIKNQPLTKQDREAISEILRKRVQWQAKTQRQDNEFGNKPKDDPSTNDRFQSRKKVISFRKIKQEQILTEIFKNQAISLYQNQTQSRMKLLEKIQKENQLKKRLSKKKSYISQYNWKQPPPIQADQNQKFYNPQSHFYTNYFQTAEGKKALSQMPQWVFRPKEIKKVQQLDPQIRSQLHATMNKTKKQQEILMNNTYQKQSVNDQSQRNQRYDTVQPQIKPSPQVYIKPSVFTQRQIDDQRFAFQSEKKAYQYHERKRKDFNVYGRERKDNIQVPSLMRTQPVSELNQKYLVTQAPVDKKVKISSMKNKLTSVASNMTQMRKQGPHANLIRTIDKGNDYSKLLQKRTMMVQADLNDRLQRDIQINPIQANFGLVKQGSNYQLKIQIKNQDVLAQRIHLKKPKSIFCRVEMKQMGPIALGMTRKISVFLRAGSQIVGKFNDEFDIVTKHEIYHIPILAQILSKNQFESSGTMLSKTVRQFEQVGKKKRQQLPPIKSP